MCTLLVCADMRAYISRININAKEFHFWCVGQLGALHVPADITENQFRLLLKSLGASFMD